MTWVLICNWSGSIVKPGDSREDFRDIDVKIGDVYAPPYRPGSLGKVQLNYADGTSGMYYPGVVHCHFEERPQSEVYR